LKGKRKKVGLLIEGINAINDGSDDEKED